jgi:hypothetical protein
MAICVHAASVQVLSVHLQARNGILLNRECQRGSGFVILINDAIAEC